MGLAVALLVYLNQPSAISVDPQAAMHAAAGERGEAASQVPKPPPAEKRFDFYALLPELEVVVPENRSHPSRASPGETVPPIPAGGATGPYILQAGSFQHAQEADSLKANLALLGIEADIQKVTVDSNAWHRVRIGPFTDLAQLNEVREQLRRNQIDTVVLRERR